MRIAAETFRSVHNDSREEAELVIFSTRLDEPQTERQDDFWPELTGRRRPSVWSAEAARPRAHLDFLARHFADPAVVPWHWPERDDGSAEQDA